MKLYFESRVKKIKHQQAKQGNVAPIHQPLIIVILIEMIFFKSKLRAFFNRQEL